MIAQMLETGPQDQIFEAVQVVERPRGEVFAFFADPVNLESITPPWLRFRLLGHPAPEMRAGAQIEYRLRLRGIPIRWRSLIDLWEPGRRFVDIQIEGPYARWHHTHTFEDVGRGTRIDDRVIYRLPFGAVGRHCAGWLVRRDVNQIFSYRQRKIEQLLGLQATEWRAVS
jgi:ligand-binding SRPBCC domain-containing protein